MASLYEESNLDCTSHDNASRGVTDEEDLLLGISAFACHEWRMWGGSSGTWVSWGGMNGFLLMSSTGGAAALLCESSDRDVRALCGVDIFTGDNEYWTMINGDNR